MRSLTWFAAFAGLSYAVPHIAPSCATETHTVYCPAITSTYTSTHLVTTVEPLAAVQTLVSVVQAEFTTTALVTITDTITVCTAGSTGAALVTSTVYTTASTASAVAKRNVPAHGEHLDCVIVSTVTSEHGTKSEYITVTKTTTIWPGHHAKSTTSTRYTGTTSITATATVTTEAACGASTTTISQDARCAPTALVSQYDGYGLTMLEGLIGIEYDTSTSDGSGCCQLCVETVGCAASGWNIQNNACNLQLPDGYSAFDCSTDGLVTGFYDYGPERPLAPGAGLYVAAICGSVDYSSDKPDDGS